MQQGQSIIETIRQQVQQKGPGSVFSSADFLALGPRPAIDQALSRLAKQGVLRRLRRGVYDFPRVHSGLGLILTPHPEAVAQALARARRSALQVSGAQAASLLGLTEQVPARIVYLTDGAPGRVQIGGQTIELRHASPRAMRTAGRVSGTVIQAFRHLGRSHITPDTRRRLRDALSASEKETLRQDRLLAPGWMQPFLDEITGETP